MIIDIAGLILWIPAILGFGTFTWVIIGRGDFDLLNGRPIFLTLLGMTLLATVTHILNFITPISANISLLVLLVGLGLFGWMLWSRRIKPKLRIVIIGIALALLISFARSGTPLHHYDTGLYGIQTVKWLRESIVPPGLANLHGRLGFNSAWLSLAAIIQVPFAADHGISYVADLMLWFAGMEIAMAFLRIAVGQWRLANVFLVCSGVILISQLFGGLDINGLSTDVAVFWVTVLVFFAALEIEDVHVVAPEAVLIIFLIALFVTLIKLSAAMVLLIPLILFVITARRLDGRERSSLILRAGGFMLVLTLPWVLRNIVLSGCMIYPIAATCIRALPWRVPASMVTQEALWIQSWARSPNLSPEQVLSSWAWLRPWLQRTFFGVDGQILLIWLVLAAGLLVSARKRTFERRKILGYSWIMVPVLCGLVFWFLTAPDFRFGAGYLAVLVLFPLAVGIYQTMGEPRGKLTAMARSLFLKLALLFMVAAIFLNMLVWPLVAMGNGRIGEDSLIFLPRPPAVGAVSKITNQGQHILIPGQGDQCWDLPRPCTPYMNPELLINQNADGNAVSFSFPAEESR